MRWKITEMLVSPSSGTAFAVARRTENLAVIVWYKGAYFLRPDNLLHTTAHGVFVDGRVQDFTIIHTMPYTPETWQQLKSKSHCPGNSNLALRICESQQNCLFKLCPYGIRMVA